MQTHKFKALITSLIATAVFSACASFKLPGPLPGAIYTDVAVGHQVTPNQGGDKTGKSCATSVLGLVATGDASIEAARKEGGITMVQSVDHEERAYFGVYAVYCTLVHGR